MYLPVKTYKHVGTISLQSSNQFPFEAPPVRLKDNSFHSHPICWRISINICES